MAAVSDLLPSPGAPVTDGTIAITGPSRPMLPVVVAGSADAAATGAAAVSAGAALAAAWRLAGAAAGAATGAAAGGAPTLEGCAEATAGCPPWLGSHATSWFAALPAIDCATCGV